MKPIDLFKESSPERYKEFLRYCEGNNYDLNKFDEVSSNALLGMWMQNQEWYEQPKMVMASNKFTQGYVAYRQEQENRKKVKC